MGIVPQRLCNQIRFLHTPRRKAFFRSSALHLSGRCHLLSYYKKHALETKHKAETGIFVVPHGEVRSPDIVVEIYM